MNTPQNSEIKREFIALMALLMSLVALAIDAMLPALDIIGKDLGIANPNDAQLIISMVFVGMSAGLIIYGPLADAFGRKPIVYLGIGIFLFGSLTSLLADNMTVMLSGRVLQGFGAASCRVITAAMIRDCYSGPKMGQIMSLIMIIFILVPALAPSLGQLILEFLPWRYIFGLLLFVGIASLLWLSLRQEETLPKDRRIPLSLANIAAGAKETISHRLSRNYTITAGLIFGAFVGYLNSSQQIFKTQYGLGDQFPLYFGSLAIAVGLSSFINSKLVMKVRMERLCIASLSLILLLTSTFGVWFYSKGGQPPLPFLMVYLAATFLCFGILFGNLNALAIDPLGHIAGIANSVIGSVQTFISVMIGTTIGLSYDGSVIPLVTGFGICSALSLGIMIYTLYRNRGWV